MVPLLVLPLNIHNVSEPGIAIVLVLKLFHLIRRKIAVVLKAAFRDPDPVVFLENELLYGLLSCCN